MTSIASVRSFRAFTSSPFAPPMLFIPELPPPSAASHLLPLLHHEHLYQTSSQTSRLCQSLNCNKTKCRINSKIVSTKFNHLQHHQTLPSHSQNANLQVYHHVPTLRSLLLHPPSNRKRLPRKRNIHPTRRSKNLQHRFLRRKTRNPLRLRHLRLLPPNHSRRRYPRYHARRRGSGC